MRHRALFLRNILLDGLSLEEERALNPYKLGVIGSTDTHTSDPGNTRSGIPARFKPAEGIGFAVNRLLEADHPVAGPIRRFLPGGLLEYGRRPTREKRYLMRCNAERHLPPVARVCEFGFRWGSAGRYR